MEKTEKKVFVKSVVGKIIIASILAFFALGLAWFSAKKAFTDILFTVKNISEPTERLRIVNKLSLELFSLDQLQRAQALSNPGNYQKLLDESKKINLIIDTLSQLYASDTLQLNRIASMKVLLQDRDKLYINYLKGREGFINNEDFLKQVESLNQIVEESSRKTDSTILESEKRTLKTTIYNLEEKKEKEQPKGFFNKIFGKKKSEDNDKGYNIINEETNVKLDTVPLVKQDSLLKGLRQTMQSIEKDQRKKSEIFQSRESVLIYTSDLLIEKMLTVLRKVESEAVKQIEQKNNEANDVVNRGIKQITIIIMVFFSITLILLYLILRDISRSNAYRKALEKAKEEAEYHGQAKQRFLANMSHEIRTPLQSIIGFSELIKNEDKIDQKHIDAIFYSSEHLMQIVNEILDYNRIVSGKIAIVPVVFNIHTVLNEVFSVLKYHAEKKGIKLYSDFDIEDIEYVKGDAFRLKQTLYNLVGNAIKFTDKGHVALNVSCKRKGKDLHFMFVVEDTGLGMSPEDVSRVFNEFERIESADKTKEGSGLGLSITKLLIERQDGRISVRSKLGEGSTFTVYLKYEDVEPHEIQQTVHSREKIDFEGKVWLVDDDPFIVDLCSTILTNYGVNHQCFYNPLDLLDAEWDESVKIVFTDIRMPQMSGVELCRKLRESLPETVKIYALTAQVLPEEKEALLKSGFDDVLNKPFKENDLLKVLNRENAIREQDLDFSVIEKMTFGDTAQLKKLIDILIADTERDLNELNDAVNRKSTQDSGMVVHKLAGRLSQFGAKEQGEKLRNLEHRFNEHPDESIWKEIQPLRAEIESVISYIKRKYQPD